ncbi:VirE2 family protein [Rhizobium ruizarguesonis]
MSGSMEVDNNADELLSGFSAVTVKDDVFRGAWVLYKDGPNPKGITRGQWMDKNTNIPTREQFAKNSYAIHASLTGNENLKVNGQFGEYDYMPPQVFVNNIQLSESQQKIVDSLKDPKGDPDETKKLQHRKAFGFRAREFRNIAGDIGISPDLPKWKRNLNGKEQVYETVGGGAQPCLAEYDSQVRAGNNIPNLHVWRNGELLQVAWHTKDGKGEYDVKSLSDAEKVAFDKHGVDVEIALKASTNRTMGTTQLDQISAGGADRRWATQIGQGREQNTHFSPLTVVLGDKNVDFKWLATHAPSHPLVKGILNGEHAETLRVIASGNGRTGIQFAMEKFPEQTTELLATCGIPKSIAVARDNDLANMRKAGAQLPAVSVPLQPHLDGAPAKGVDVMRNFDKDQIMIANRGRSGDLTGAQRTLGEYEAQKLPLPEDAAKALGLEPNVYSQEKTANRYDNRARGGGGASAADW